MNEKEKQAINDYVRKAMKDFGLHGEEIRLAISQAVWRAVGRTELRAVNEALSYMTGEDWTEFQERIYGDA